MFVDTHCHLSNEDYKNIEEVLKENRQAGVSSIIISGCTKESISESLEYAKKYSDVFATIGYHPSEADIIIDSDLSFLEEQLCLDKVVGLGEIGLDYHYGKENREKQISLFEKQLAIAEKHHLPVVIHSRDATFDTIDCLKKYSVSGVIHCFSGSLETAKEYIKMGFFLGIGGVITFKNSNLADTVTKIPLDSIVLETDSPYLTPHPYRGTTNEPKYIDLIADFICEELHISKSQLEKITNRNISTIFDIL